MIKMAFVGMMVLIVLIIMIMSMGNNYFLHECRLLWFRDYLNYFAVTCYAFLLSLFVLALMCLLANMFFILKLSTLAILAAIRDLE